MRRTLSGAYQLPNTIEGVAGNMILRTVRFVPSWLGGLYLRRQKFYQTVGETNPEETQGDSMEKWKLISTICNVQGKSVLDIGCSEGVFCVEAVRAGASRVVGIDSEVRSLIIASLLARSAGLRVKYRLETFPEVRLKEQFDCVLCLSVLHHLVSVKDMWALLSDSHHYDDLLIHREHLRSLRSMVAPGGTCIVEIPYVYREIGRAHV